MTESRHTADSITDDALDRLYAERDELRQRMHNQMAGATELIAQLGTTEAEAVAARSAIDRVRELHQPMDRAEFMYCGHCSSWDGQRVRGVLTDWPCDTIAALPAAEEQQPAEHVGDGANAEDCPACAGTNPPYPFICPGPATV